jgi:hypothetical protein
VTILVIFSTIVTSLELETNEPHNHDLETSGMSNGLTNGFNEPPDNNLGVDELNSFSESESDQNDQSNGAANEFNNRGDDNLSIKPRAPEGIQVHAQIFASGHCGGQPAFRGGYRIGQCHNFPAQGGGKYGAKFQNRNCRYKVWQNRDCKGKATVHGARKNWCIAIANNDKGQFYLPFGGASISIQCTN